MIGYNFRSDVRWHEMFDRYMTDWPALAQLAAMAWRQASDVAQTDQAMASNLQCNQWSISGICGYLDSHGVRPDEMTLRWAVERDGGAPPVPFFVAR